MLLCIPSGASAGPAQRKARLIELAVGTFRRFSERSRAESPAAQVLCHVVLSPARAEARPGAKAEALT